MSEKEDRDAAREAMRELIDHPERTPAHEEALRRYLRSVAYAEEQQEQRDRERTSQGKKAEGDADA